jgi:adenylate cyclase
VRLTLSSDTAARRKPRAASRRCATLLPTVRKILIGLVIGTAAVLAAAGAGLAPFIQTVERKTYDWRIQATADPASARRDVVLVAIDQSSIRNLEPLVGRWPWPRMVHATLVDFLARGPAKVVVYDVVFAERDRRSLTVGEDTWTGEESDRALVEATARAGNVVHVVDVAAEAGGGVQAGFPVVQPFRLDDRIESRPVVAPPFGDLAKASRALGHNLVAADPDGPVRRAIPFVRGAGQFLPSLSVAAALIAGGIPASEVTTDTSALHLGSRVVPLVDAELSSFDGRRHPSRRMLIRYPGGVLDPTTKRPTYSDYSFYDLFYSEQQIEAGAKPLVDPARFKDAVVVVGTTAPGLFDLITVPFAQGKMPGMQIHASVIDNLLSGRFMAPAPAWAGVLLSLLCAVVAGVAIVRLGVWPGIALSAAVAALAAAGSMAAFSRGVWLPVVEPALALVLAVFGGVSYQYLVEGREKRQVKKLFARYVSKDVFDQLMADPSRAQLGGQRREMTVLFSDIRGFTTFSEQGEPEEIVRQLNEYLSRMVHVLFDYRGTLDKFVGDAVMALFGAPLEDPDHAEHAVQAALAMLGELDELNRGWAAQGRPTLAIGVGINTGEMVAGNIGSVTIMSYTVIGDAVNLGSRLESLNKQYGTTVIVSETTRARLKGRYDIRPLGDVVVKGKTKPVAVFEVRKPAEAVETAGAGRL